MQEFKKVIEEMIGLFEGLTAVERRKVEASKRNDVAAIEECMKKEQAAVMKLKGLDRQREQAARDNGWEGKSFREILEMDPENRRELGTLFDALTDKLHIFQECLGDAAGIISVNLHLVNEEMDRRGAGIYDGTGSQKEPAAHLRSRKA